MKEEYATETICGPQNPKIFIILPLMGKVCLPLLLNNTHMSELILDRYQTVSGMPS